jgi:hypothetical protein
MEKFDKNIRIRIKATTKSILRCFRRRRRRRE